MDLARRQQPVRHLLQITEDDTTGEVVETDWEIKKPGEHITINKDTKLKHSLYLAHPRVAGMRTS